MNGIRDWENEQTVYHQGVVKGDLFPEEEEVRCLLEKRCVMDFIYFNG